MKKQRFDRQTLAAIHALLRKGGGVRPLAIGIHKAVIEQGHDKLAVQICIHKFVNKPKYLRSLVAGAVRTDLDGNPAGVVTEQEAQDAATRLQQMQESEERRKLAREAAEQARQANEEKRRAKEARRLEREQAKIAAEEAESQQPPTVAAPVEAPSPETPVSASGRPVLVLKKRTRSAG